MEQFTVSEVRDAITWKYGDKLTRISAMLNAFADLLEAQEKAVPVAWLRDSGTAIESEAACVTNTVRNLWLASNPKRIERYTIPLYAHPASPDAERLAEALREQAAKWVGSMYFGMSDEYEQAILEACANDINNWTVPGMVDTRPKTHGTQTRPAASVPTMRFFIGGPRACAYVDKDEHVEAVITALCDCTGDDRDDYTSTDLLASERVR